MEINPVVVHDAANKRVEGKTKPANEMGEENNSLMGLRSRDDLSRQRETVTDLLGQIPGFPTLLDILLLDGRGHPFASCSRFGHLWRISLRWKMRKPGR